MTSSPAPMLSWLRATIRALVPFTTARLRFTPKTFDHAASNSVTTSALDHMPLLNTSSTRFSSVSGFQIGHFTHFISPKIGIPPKIAGAVILLPPRRPAYALAPKPIMPAYVAADAFTDWLINFLRDSIIVIYLTWCCLYFFIGKF